jgi:hypothetical protein
MKTHGHQTPWNINVHATNTHEHQYQLNKIIERNTEWKSSGANENTMSNHESHQKPIK